MGKSYAITATDMGRIRTVGYAFADKSIIRQAADFLDLDPADEKTFAKLVDKMQADPNMPLPPAIDKYLFEQMQRLKGGYARALALRPRAIGVHVGIEEGLARLQEAYPERAQEVIDKQLYSVETYKGMSSSAVAAVVGVMLVTGGVYYVASRRPKKYAFK